MSMAAEISEADMLIPRLSSNLGTSSFTKLRTVSFIYSVKIEI
jgi:hypothetical protein